MTTAASNPWETPPDESYWHGLLKDVEREALPSEPKRSTDETTTDSPPHISPAYDKSGKVLASGELDHPVTVAAYSFSEGARKKIVQTEGRAVPLTSLLEKQVEPSKIKILK